MKSKQLVVFFTKIKQSIKPSKDNFALSFEQTVETFMKLDLTSENYQKIDFNPRMLLVSQRVPKPSLEQLSLLMRPYQQDLVKILTELEDSNVMKQVQTCISINVFFTQDMFAELLVHFNLLENSFKILTERLKKPI